MKRSVFVCAMLVATGGALAAQQASQSSDPYAGISHPPPDTTITTPEPPPLPKPSPGKLAPPPAAAQPSGGGAQAPAGQQYAEPDTGDGIVRVAPDVPDAQTPAQPELNQREDGSGQREVVSGDPDGDIVHPAPLPPGELGSGTTIRARLLEEISTNFSRDGDTFRARVASDVFRGNDVLIPTGAEIDGKVDHISTGRAGGHGSMYLRPDTVILPNGSRYHLYAQLTGAPGSGTRVSGEGAVTPGSRMKKDGFEYGGAVGTGVIAGAVLGGPVGALAGSIVGAGVVTAHLVMDHPQANLPTGTVLMFTLTETLNLEPANPAPSQAMAPAANPVAGTPTEPAASQDADPQENSAANPDADAGEVGNAGPR